MRPFDPETRHLVPPPGWVQFDDDWVPSRVESPAPVDEAIRAGLGEERLTYEDLLPYRVFTAWRLVRRLALWKGMIQADDLLVEALAPSGGETDPWLVSPLWGYQQGMFLAIPQEIIRLHRDAEGLNPGFLPTVYGETIRTIPLLPPPVPLICYPLETYDPDKDPLLRFYIAALRRTARVLDVESGSAENPLLGKWGMAGLINPWWVRQVFPTRSQIVSIEQAVVDETLQLMVGPEKQMGAEVVLRSRYGFDRFEILSLVRMAKREAFERTRSDSEHDRALMLLRLEDFCRRSHEALDLRSELMSMKQMAGILGLTREGAKDMMDDMVDVVRTVSRERSRPELPSEENS